MNLESAMLTLIQHYIQRQPLVFEIMTALRPDKFAFYDKSILKPEMIDMVKKYQGVSQSGEWQNDEGIWDYFFHGAGCRLTHKETGERIDWDVPDVKVFDRYFFLKWLEWAIVAKPESLKQELALISEAIDEDEEDSLWSLVKTTIQTLLEQKSLALASPTKQAKLYLVDN